MAIWTTHELQEDTWFSLTLGPMRAWLRRRNDEWHIASEPGKAVIPELPPASLEPDPDGPPEEIEIRRWVLREPCPSITLSPVMPDRTVVVRPEHPLRLTPRATALLFVGIPASVRLTVPTDVPTNLSDEPAVQLSNIWLGTPQSGELCYGMRTYALRAVEDFHWQPQRIICPVRIRNVSQEDLDIERIALPVRHLAIYRGETWLWANETEFSARGEDRLGRIAYKEGPPEYRPSLELMTPATQPVQRSLLRTGFGLRMFGR